MSAAPNNSQRQVAAPILVNVARCIYQQAGTKNYFHSVRLDGKAFPTKRKLAATTKTAAIKEVETLNTRLREASIGVGLNPYATGLTITEIARKWFAADCPDREGIRRTGQKLEDEKAIVNRALKWWGNKEVLGIIRKQCRQYKDWRTAQSEKLRLTRSVDRELLALSNVFEWAIEEDLMKVNPLAGRKKFDDPRQVRHCTAVSIRSDEEFHQLAKLLFASDQSRALGWQLLLEGMTGVRTSELLACRLDATAPTQPGYLDHHALTVLRLKDGIEPYALLEAAPGHSPLRDCLQAFLNWHDKRKIKTPWFIPGRTGKDKPNRCSLTHALHRACRVLKIPLVTSHGLRAYFVSAQRSMGISDDEIATRLGHKSTQQVEQTYGTVRPGWRGSWKMDFLPEDFAPAWTGYLPKTTYQKLIVPEAKDQKKPKQSSKANPAPARANKG